MPFKLCPPSIGVLGETRLTPSSSVISSNTNQSKDFTITLISSSPSEEQANIYVTLSDENGNHLDGIDFEFKNGNQYSKESSKYNIKKDVLNNTFSFFIKKVTSNTKLIFRITKEQPLQADTKCFINVDATASGFGAAVSEILFKAFTGKLTTGGAPDLQDQQDSLIDSISIDALEQEEPAIADTLSESDLESLFKPKIISEYNFYIPSYEKLISLEDVGENIIPSINYLYVEPKIINSELQQIRTLKGLLDGRSNSRDLSIKPKIIKDFFEEYTLDVSYQTKIKSKMFDSLKTQKICLFPNDYSKVLLPEVEKYTQNFPMSIKFEFYVDSIKTQLNSLLKETGMLDYFCYCLITEFSGSVRNIKLDSFLRKFFSENSNSIVNLNSILYLGNISKNIANFNLPTSNSFIKAIMSKVFLTRVASNSEVVRDEIIMYEIVKSYNGTTITKNYFINDFENEFIKFYDTQVKYDKLYKYEINRISVRSSQYIVREQVLSVNKKVFDLPPVQPDVTYVQYKGEDKKILINLNAGIGKYEDYPVEINDNDKIIFDNIQKDQDKKDGDKLKFESDDPVSEFEIIRIDFEPSSFQDFKDGKSVSLSTKVDGEVKFNASSYVDDILPNKKYYYISRSKDVHGNISNPTAPIQIEIINENGTIYLNKKEYVFKTIPKISTKDLRKFIEIKVADEQSVINPKTFKNNAKSAFELKNITLGNTDISVWEKEFLMRVTSKMTGKKIDIKFKFNFTQPPIRERKPKS